MTRIVNKQYPCTHDSTHIHRVWSHPPEVLASRWLIVVCNFRIFPQAPYQKCKLLCHTRNISRQENFSPLQMGPERIYLKQRHSLRPNTQSSRKSLGSSGVLATDCLQKSRLSGPSRRWGATYNGVCVMLANDASSDQLIEVSLLIQGSHFTLDDSLTNLMDVITVYLEVRNRFHSFLRIRR